MVWNIKEGFKDDLDQFAYQINSDTDDAINTVVHHVVKHLEDPKTHARVFVLDVSSAFTTIQL